MTRPADPAALSPDDRHILDQVPHDAGVSAWRIASAAGTRFQTPTVGAILRRLVRLGLVEMRRKYPGSKRRDCVYQRTGAPVPAAPPAPRRDIRTVTVATPMAFGQSVHLTRISLPAEPWRPAQEHGADA